MQIPPAPKFTESVTLEAGRVPLRAEMDAASTWDLTLMYADDIAWDSAYQATEARLPELSALQGTLATSAASLRAALQKRDEIVQLVWKLYIYAHLRQDSDSNDAAGQALESRAKTLTVRLDAMMAFFNPEILAIAESDLKAWLSQDSELAVYAYHLQDLTRQKAHIRSAEVEAVMAEYGELISAPYNIFRTLSDTDLVFPEIEDETNQKVRLSSGRYVRYMESSARKVRRDTFVGLHSTYKQVANTVGASLTGAVQSHMVNAKLRGYSSSLEAALKPNDIPLAVYHNLVNTVDANLHQMHRYVSLRKRMMGLDTIHFYDLRAPLAVEVNAKVPYADGKKLVLDSLQPLGATYGAMLGEAFNKRWIDVYENKGKRSGAYSSGSYVTAPYILLNYQDTLNDVFTLAHELGHSMHSYLTRKHQPHIYGDYTIFLAEVASTLNEALLSAHIIKTSDDAALKRQVLVQEIEDIRTTILRQTMFATYELRIHELAEAGTPLTRDLLTNLYTELVKRYHGPEMIFDEELGYEWARIPHFYYNFYVYQYATGLSSALALSKQILGEGQPAVDRYLKALSSGSSRPSVDILRDAGVDMTTPAPVQAAMETFGNLLDQLEALA
jgi:oligoendopeptidase F